MYDIMYESAVQDRMMQLAPHVEDYIQENELRDRAQQEKWLDSREVYNIEVRLYADYPAGCDWKPVGISGKMLTARIWVPMNRKMTGIRLDRMLYHEITHAFLPVLESAGVKEEREVGTAEYMKQPWEAMAEEVATYYTGITTKEHLTREKY